MTPINNIQTLNICFLGGKDEVAEEEVKTTNDSFDPYMEEIEFDIPSDVDLDAETFSNIQLENF